MTAHANGLVVDVRGAVEILQGNRSRDGGEGSVLGTDPAHGTRAWRSRVGIVWQDESAPAELTVRETVRHFARSYPKPRDPEKLIGLVGLEARRKPDQGAVRRASRAAGRGAGGDRRP
jgi:ABC-type multidrug transport system ATPase subunit